MAAKWIETLTGSIEQTKRRSGSTRPARARFPSPTARRSTPSSGT